MKKTFTLFAFILFTTLSYSQTATVTVEAESGVIGADYEIVSGDPSYVQITSNGIMQFPESDARAIKLEVIFPEAGEYYLYGRFRVGPGGGDDDSYFYANDFGARDFTDQDQWVTINNTGGIGYTTSESVVSTQGGAGGEVWKWLNLSLFSNSDAAVSFQVGDAATSYEFWIGAREDGLDIDKFVFGKADLFYTVANLDAGEDGSDEPPGGGGGGNIDEWEPLARNHPKFLGSAHSGNQNFQFTNLWNQVTPENGGKWGQVERQRDQMNWGGLDAAYNLAKENGYVFKDHVLIWGNQQPAWIENLSTAEQKEEIEEWYAAVAERYPDLEYIEVVNEPISDPPSSAGNGGGNYIEALGGTGATGWDWIINSFKMARKYFPNTKLMLNEYGIVNSPNKTATYIGILELLIAEDLIDAVGVQAHAFSLNGGVGNITNNLNRITETGLPIFATEFDIDGLQDFTQLETYQTYFPAFWEHPAIKGITMWGYRTGHWRTQQGAYIVDPDTGEPRAALNWLREYVEGSYIPLTTIEVTSEGDVTTIETDDANLQLSTIIAPTDASYQFVSWSVDDRDIAVVDKNGLVKAKSNGTVVVTATSEDLDSIQATITLTVSGQDGLTATEDLNDYSHLQIYPNPIRTGESMIIEGANKFDVVRLINVKGAVLSSIVSNHQNKLEIKVDVPTGLYLVQMINNNTVLSKKIMVLE